MQISIFISGVGFSISDIPLSVEMLTVDIGVPWHRRYAGPTYGGTFGIAFGGIVGWTVPDQFQHLFYDLNQKRFRLAIYDPVLIRRDADCEIWVYGRDGTPTNISRRAMPCAGNLLGAIDVTATLSFWRTSAEEQQRLQRAAIHFALRDREQERLRSRR